MNIAIGLSCSWDFIPVEFFHSWIRMKKPKHSVVFSNRGRSDDMRNSIINQVLTGNDEFSHVLFLDIDHYHHPDTLPKLLSHNKDIVSGLSFRRSEPYDPIMFNFDGERYKNITSWEDGKLLEVDAVGGASLLVKTEVLKTMGKSKWFEFHTNKHNGLTSEDIYFCQKAKGYGYKVFVDTSCTNEHLGKIGINKKTWENYNRGISL